jgi:hypothetical protein
LSLCFSKFFQSEFILGKKAASTLHGIKTLETPVAQEQESAGLVGRGILKSLCRVVATVATFIIYIQPIRP